MNIVTATAIVLLQCGIQGVNGEDIIDLTHELDTEMPIWPGDPPFRFTILSRGQFEDYWYEINNFTTGEHSGTHLDAPSHFAKGKWRVHDIPLSHLIGPGVVIDITARAKNSPDAQVEIEDFLKWEKSFGQIPDRAIILMNSGWSEFWPNATAVFGSSNVNDAETFHFPGFSPQAAQWLVDNRNINAIGVDSPSIDYGQSRLFETHVIICNASIIALENLANVQKVPPAGTTIYAIPIKLRDGSGSPVRTFAVINDRLTSSASPTHCPYLLIMYVFFCHLCYHS